MLTFPLWWYTVGLALFWNWTKSHYHYSLQKTGLLVFAKHMREPLYGDYSKAGIILSFFLRIVILVYKLVVFTLRVLALCILGILYLIILPILIIMIVFQIFGIG